MKAEINNENKVKFFALYWAQKVFVNPLLGDEPVRNTFVFNEHEPEDIYYEYLQLKPLLSISQEDIVFMARIVGVSEEDINSGLKPDFRDGFSEFLEEQFYPSVIVDYLRSRGYALPWMGLSVEEMVEAGWIKLT